MTCALLVLLVGDSHETGLNLLKFVEFLVVAVRNHRGASLVIFVDQLLLGEGDRFGHGALVDGQLGNLVLHGAEFTDNLSIAGRFYHSYIFFVGRH